MLEDRQRNLKHQVGRRLNVGRLKTFARNCLDHSSADGRGISYEEVLWTSICIFCVVSGAFQFLVGLHVSNKQGRRQHEGWECRLTSRDL